MMCWRTVTFCFGAVYIPAVIWVLTKIPCKCDIQSIMAHGAYTRQVMIIRALIYDPLKMALVLVNRCYSTSTCQQISFLMYLDFINCNEIWRQKDILFFSAVIIWIIWRLVIVSIVAGVKSICISGNYLENFLFLFAQPNVEFGIYKMWNPL